MKKGHGGIDKVIKLIIYLGLIIAASYAVFVIFGSYA